MGLLWFDTPHIYYCAPHRCNATHVHLISIQSHQTRRVTQAMFLNDLPPELTARVISHLALLETPNTPYVTSGPQQQQQPHYSPPDTYDVSEPLLQFGTAFAGPGTPEGPMDGLETFLAGIPSNDGSEEWEAEEISGPTQAYSASMPGNGASVGFDPAAYDIP
jgi:hypothetical protein